MKKRYITLLALLNLSYSIQIHTISLSPKSPYNLLQALSANASKWLAKLGLQKAASDPEKSTINWKSIPTLECIRTFLANSRNSESVPYLVHIYPFSTLPPLKQILEKFYQEPKEPSHAQ